MNSCCGIENSRVYDSRVLVNGMRTRYRKCHSCGDTFKTVEVIEREELSAHMQRDYVHKKDLIKLFEGLPSQLKEALDIGYWNRRDK